MTEGLLHAAAQAAWAFFALGPQLALCLAFSLLAARRRGGDPLAAAARGALWSLVPFAGVVATWWDWHRARRRRPEAAT